MYVTYIHSSMCIGIQYCLCDIHTDLEKGIKLDKSISCNAYIHTSDAAKHFKSETGYLESKKLP